MSFLFQPRLGLLRSVIFRKPSSIRLIQHEAHDASFDPDDLSDAREWHRSFQPSSIPKGNTTFSRSSGPGGQHVNKTETKATTTWPIGQLLSILPKLLHSGIRSSKYYAKRNDCISLQAQTGRSRTANTEENYQKLFEEIQALYRDSIPGETSPEKKGKYSALKKSSNEARIRAKKLLGSKKTSRRSSYE